MKASLGLALVMIGLGVGVCTAQTTPVAPVQVDLGPAVADRAGDLGRTELQREADYLRTGVERLLSRRHERPALVHLTIADIEPNRPTSAQLGASTQLRADSFGVGGAAITGEVVLADGRKLPVRYRYFQDQLRDESNFTTWGDADEAFDTLAGLIAAGRIPNDPKTWPPSHVARAVTGTRIPG